MIKKLLICFVTFQGIAQTGVNTKTPNPSSALHISSVNQGVLLPQYQLVSLTNNLNPVANPLEGALIYNLGGTFIKGYYYWSGSQWDRLLVNSEMDQILNLKLPGGTDATNSPSIIPAGNNTTPYYINYLGITPSINTLGVPNPTGTGISLPAGTYKVDISFDANATSSISTGNIGNNSHLYNVVAAIVDNDTGIPISDIKTVTSISGSGSQSVQGYYFSFVFTLTVPRIVKLQLNHGSGRSTYVATNRHQAGLVVNFRRFFE